MNHLKVFRELITRYPDSKYRPDAIKRMNFLFNTVAMGEIYVARYYMKRGAYIAAVNRAQYTLNEYPQTPATKYALEIMVDAYDELGMNDLRDDAKRVLDKNFSGKKKELSEISISSDNDSWWEFW